MHALTEIVRNSPTKYPTECISHKQFPMILGIGGGGGGGGGHDNTVRMITHSNTQSVMATPQYNHLVILTKHTVEPHYSRNTRATSGTTTEFVLNIEVSLVCKNYTQNQKRQWNNGNPD